MLICIHALLLGEVLVRRSLSLGRWIKTGGLLLLLLLLLFWGGYVPIAKMMLINIQHYLNQGCESGSCKIFVKAETNSEAFGFLRTGSIFHKT